MYPRKTIHEKSRRIIYEFSYKMGVLNEKRCKRKYTYIIDNNGKAILIYFATREKCIGHAYEENNQ